MNFALLCVSFATTGLVINIAASPVRLFWITQTISESVRLRRTRYLPAGKAFSPTVKLNGMFTTVTRSACANTDETVTRRTKPVKAIALLMCFIMLSFPHLLTRKEKQKGATDGTNFYLISFPRSRQVINLILFSSRTLRKASLVKKSKSRWRHAAPQFG